jgi:hypothetical protein
LLHVITEVVAEREGVVRLRYADGLVCRVDLMPALAQGGVFSALADPVIFQQVRIGSRGRSIEFPGEIDFCADALRREGAPIPEPSFRETTTAG